MTFKDYLISRKIDPSAFAKSEPRRYREFGLLYDQVHLKSFVMQKLFILNGLRHQYPFTEDIKEESAAGRPKASVKPVMKKSPKAATGAKPKMAKPKPAMKPKVGGAAGAKPKPSVKPKISGKPKPVISGEKKAAKPKIQPKPIIKKK
jgi:hypothetical protein